MCWGWVLHTTSVIRVQLVDPALPTALQRRRRRPGFDRTHVRQLLLVTRADNAVGRSGGPPVFVTSKLTITSEALFPDATTRLTL